MEDKNKSEDLEFRDEALFLVKTYAWMQREAKRLENLLAGSWEYTDDDAIAELQSISVQYDGIRVQGGTVSSPTERVVMKLLDPDFMKRKQAEVTRAKHECEDTLDYIRWKLGVVSKARKRMTEREYMVLKQKFGAKSRSYKEIQRGCRNGISISCLSRDKDAALAAICEELMMIQALGEAIGYIGRLVNEAHADRSDISEVGNGKNKKD